MPRVFLLSAVCSLLLLAGWPLSALAQTPAGGAAPGDTATGVRAPSDTAAAPAAAPADTLSPLERALRASRADTLRAGADTLKASADTVRAPAAGRRAPPREGAAKPPLEKPGAARPGAPGGPATAAGDTLVVDALYQRLVAEAEPGQVVYHSDRLTLYPSDKVILLSGRARAEQDSTVLTANRIAYARDENIIQAFGEALVVRGANKLSADTLVYDQGSGNVSTFGPSRLTEGSEEVTGENLRYSMDRQSGILAAGRTQYDRWYLRGEDMNKIGQRTFVVREGSFTTDPADPPDYHFSSEQIKLKRDDVIIAQPVVLYVSDVPIFYLPWYLEPLGTGRKSGILRPKVGINTLINASGGERNVQDLGYYWAISDYMDAQAALDWFSESRTILRFDYRYALRYLLRGSAHYEQVWNRNIHSKDTLLRFSHDHDFDPSTHVGVDVNWSTSRRFFERNSFDPNRILQRALRSNASLTRRFTWGNLTAGASSDLQLQQNRTDFKLPSIQLSLNQRPLFPGSRLDRSWKRNLVIGASTSFDFDLSTQGDTLTGRDSTVTHQQTSITRATLSGPFDLLGFIKTTPSVDFTQTLFNNNALPDSLEAAGAPGFGQLQTLGASLSFAASVFRVFQGGPGPVTKLRHSVSPQLSFRYQPATTPREELPLGFPGGGGREVLTANFNLTNSIDLKVRETQATAQRRADQEGRVRRAREAGLLKPRAELTLEEQMKLDSIAVADSLAKLEEQARKDSLEQREEQAEKTLEETAAPDTGAARQAAPQGAARPRPEAAPAGRRAGEEKEGGAAKEEGFTERVVRLVSINNRMGFDFVRNSDPRLLGFSTLSTTVSSQVSSAVSVNVSATHDLTDTRFRNDDPAQGTEEFFDPFLASVNTQVRFGGGRDFPDLRAFRGARRVDEEEVTDAEAGQGAFSDGVGLGDQPPGFEAIESSSLGRWDIDLTHTLSRRREGEGRQSLRFGTSFHPTRNWALRYATGYDITDTKFQDQSLSLVRDLNRWQATLNLSVFPADPQDRVLVEVAVFLRDIPDLRIPYRTRRE